MGLVILIKPAQRHGNGRVKSNISYRLMAACDPLFATFAFSTFRRQARNSKRACWPRQTATAGRGCKFKPRLQIQTHAKDNNQGRNFPPEFSARPFECSPQTTSTHAAWARLGGKTHCPPHPRRPSSPTPPPPPPSPWPPPVALLPYPPPPRRGHLLAGSAGGRNE